MTTERCPFLLARCKGVRPTLLNKKVCERRGERDEDGELSALRHRVAGKYYLLLAFTSDLHANSTRTTSRWPWLLAACSGWWPPEKKAIVFPSNVALRMATGEEKMAGMMPDMPTKFGYEGWGRARAALHVLCIHV